MSAAPLRVLPTPEGIGEQIAPKILEDIARARNSGARYLLGCPTGRTPRPIYAAIARRLAHTRQDLSHLVLVMMDEYLVPSARGFKYAASTNRWSCHDFARRELADQWNSVLPAEFRLRDDSVWFPDPNQPETYDIEIRRAGGIDLFLLASGASDGHVAFNPPGSARNSTTRIIELSDETRRDNLKTFPSFGKLSKVPTHGISVGIDTIASARRKVMVVWGEGKRLTLKRIIAASRYESDWPATVVHEGVGGEILADNAASA
ncbi:MAG TPA: 6-phosphogluconolactonase [Gemmatimonadaceae bacterium]|jgi:glucosamine-6-phosphate deaminase